MSKVVIILRKCRINSKYKGYKYIPDAVEIIIQLNKDRKNIHMIRDVYPVIAEKYQTTVGNIEADIRNTIKKCWKNNKEYVQEILGYFPLECPSNIEFLEAIASYIKTDK